MEPARILIADDHRMLREGLRALLEAESDLLVVAEADDGHACLEETRIHQPDVVVMDIAMPGLNGIEATRQLLSEFPDIKVVALSMHADRRFVLRMLQAGASGYLLKNSASKELVSAIRNILAGNTHLSPSVAGLVVQGALGKGDHFDPGVFGVLTDREREVLQLLAEGRSTKEIAGDLGISPRTAEAHRKNIMDKLGVNSVAVLTKYAIREGLTSLDL